MKHPSAEQRPTAWFDRAGFGIFIHWSIFTVPGWAVSRGAMSYHEAIADAEEGVEYFFKHNPYSEWYMNTITIEGSPAAEHHREVYGNSDYFDFRHRFRDESAGFDAQKWADLFQRWSAEYVVFVTKHHDGYVLWPSAVTNPRVPDWQSSRDYVGELFTALHQRGIKAGVYYSGGPDWTFDNRPVTSAAQLCRTIPDTPEYTGYVMAHYKELIDRYQPDILWNDIGTPASLKVRELFSYYKERIPHGVVNDRFQPVLPPRKAGGFLDALYGRLALKVVTPNTLAGSLWRRIRPYKVDVDTPEYSTFKKPVKFKWETCRGLGRAFGYNRNETAADIMTAGELIELLVNIVSKNGNLILNPAFKADGSLVDYQAPVLEEFSRFMHICGPMVKGTVACRQAEDHNDNRRVYYTAAADGSQLHVFIFGLKTERFSFNLAWPAALRAAMRRPAQISLAETGDARLADWSFNRRLFRPGVVTARFEKAPLQNGWPLCLSVVF